MQKLYLTLAVLVAGGTLIAQTATINWNQERQTIDGFGGSSAWFVDELMRHPDREALLDLLYEVDGGAGLSILRHRVSPKPSDQEDFGMELGSGDLDLGTKHLTGLRFRNVTVPQGATITDARIQFTAKDDSNTPSSLTIWGQASNSSSAFTAAAGNLNDRNRTGASVNWQVGNWTAGSSGSNERTPNLKGIVQQVVNRSGWSSGNAMVFLVGDYSGKRSALSYENNSSQAARLILTLSNGQTVSRTVSSGEDDAEESGVGAWRACAQMSQKAFARDCDKVWASSWSPPYEWKTSGAERNGFLEQDHYQDFADHLEAYRAFHDANAGGAQLYGISPQNEPGQKPWESCEWNAGDFRDFVKNHAGPTINTRILAPEVTRWANLDNRYDPIHNDPAARAATDIICGHVYDQQMDIDYTGDYDKPIWQTEWSYDTSPEDAGIANGARWAHNVHRMLVNANVNAWHHWWLINFKNDGRQQGLINAVADVPGYSTTKRFWTIGNFSKFVRPGWKRIDATANPTADVYVSAYKDPTTGKFAIVVINRSGSAKNVTLDFNGFSAGQLTPHRTSGSENLNTLGQLSAGGSASVSLPAQSVTTFTGANGSTGGGNEQTPYAGTPFQIQDGAVLRATHYDNGGPGVAYYDTSPGNTGGCGRADDVDKAGGTNCALAWNVAGEWVEYTVDVATAGTYDVDLRMATPNADKTVRLKLGGATLGTIDCSNASTGWSDYRSVTLQGVTLGAGTQVLRLEIVDDGVNVKDLTFRLDIPSGQTPYFGSPQAITDGSVLKVWTYDNGGPGVAFSDTDDGNRDGCGRNDDIDLGGSGGNCNLGWIVSGEWVEYTVDVTAGTYDIDVSMASKFDDKTLRLKLGGQALGQVDCDNASAGWNDYRTTTLSGVSLNGGTQVLRLEMLDSYFNISKLTFRRLGSASGAAPTTAVANVGAEEWALFPNPATAAVSVRPPGRTAAYRVMLLDINGRRLRAYPPATGMRTLDLAGLEAGVYLLRLETDDAPASVHRLVVRHN